MGCTENLNTINKLSMHSAGKKTDDGHSHNSFLGNQGANTFSTRTFTKHKD